MSPYQELLECGNGPIADAAMKCEAMFASHDRAMISISGGADSDAMLDLSERVRTESPIDIAYVWFDTGLEYRATTRHLEYLEERYDIHIERIRAEKTVPVCCAEYGQPFMSKSVSEFVGRLQKHGFQWEDEPYEVLSERYPRCESALRWWCADNGSGSRFNISRNKHLKEFMIDFPPRFRVSNKCCYWAKKIVAKKAVVNFSADLNMVGVRKAEGGNRAALKTCVTTGNGVDTYRPMFWWNDETRFAYAKAFGIRNSDCYVMYGLKRTGCVGCPFAKNHLAELGVMAQYEPNLCKAAMNVFGDAYDYTMAYRDYVRRLEGNGQMNLFDLIGE